MTAGSKVTVIPRATHREDIKKHYGKVLEIDRIAIGDGHKPFFKVKGIKGYAVAQDLSIV